MPAITRPCIGDVANTIAGDISVYTLTNPDKRRAVVDLTLSLSDVFQRHNRRFDKCRFLRACGFNEDDAPLTFALERKKKEAEKNKKNVV